MVETSDLRRRLQHVIAESRRATQERRVHLDAVAQDGERTLRQVVAPVFRQVASVLKAEGFSFRVSTPVGAVRLSAGASGERFVELELDMAGDPAVLRVRVSRSRGRRVLVDEKVVRQDAAIAELTEEDVLTCLLSELGAVLEK